MFVTRALTVAVALPVFAAALLLLPRWAWALFLLPALFIGAWEWGGLSGFARTRRFGYAAVVTASAIALGFYAMGPWRGTVPAEWWLYGLSVLFWVSVAPAWLRGHWTVRQPLALAITGWIVLVPMWLALVRLQERPWALLLFMSIVWIADTAAYLAGRQWGRRKLAPRISPGKSWEGVAGAGAALVVYWAALWLVASPGHSVLPAPWALVAFAAVLVLSIEGDLFESWMKRVAGLKDSGQLLPGHGGILDRVDALTSTMPAAALILYLH